MFADPLGSLLSEILAQVACAVADFLSHFARSLLVEA
jgi:hypothetical protein